jgi:hypothetical protein
MLSSPCFVLRVLLVAFDICRLVCLVKHPVLLLVGVDAIATLLVLMYVLCSHLSPLISSLFTFHSHTILKPHRCATAVVLIALVFGVDAVVSLVVMVYPLMQSVRCLRTAEQEKMVPVW